MKKLSLLLIATAAFAVLLTACQNQIWSRSDTEVAFDSSGHMTQDVMYTWSNSTETFSADGTYEYIIKSWDAASSSWKQSSGSKGTYLYDTNSRMMTITYSQQWQGGTTGSYATLTTSSSAPKTSVYPEAFGSTNEYEILIGSSGNYVETGNTTYWNGTSSTYNWSCAVPSDLSMVTWTYESENYDAGGTATRGSKNSDAYTVSTIFPTSVTSIDKAKGKTVTFNTNKDVNTVYTWTSGTNFTAGTPTTNNTSGGNTLSVASDGSYIAYIDVTVARHLASK